MWLQTYGGKRDVLIPPAPLLKQGYTEAAADGAARKLPASNVTSAEIAARPAKPKPAARRKPKADPTAARALVADYKQLQLATLVSEPPAGRDWLHEIKYDGYRIVCAVSKRGVAIRTRNGLDWTAKFPALAAALAELKVTDAVLDGEAVMLDNEGRSSFPALQQALGDGGDPSRIQGYFFDILRLNGKDLSGKTLTDRRKLLAKIFKCMPAAAPLHFSEALESHPDVLAKACAMGLEGVVSKRKSATYFHGRSRDWQKSKCSKRQEFIIIGFTRASNEHCAIGALHLAYMSEGELAYAGKVGTGFSHGMAGQIYQRLEPLEMTEPKAKGAETPALRGTVWVKPQVLCEVSFAEWTETGYLRHPSFVGLREDKNPAEVTKEQPVEMPQVFSGYKQFEDKNERH